MEKRVHICHLSSVHFALDTRLFYRFCRSLASHYEVTLIAVHPSEEIRDGVKIIPFHRFKNKLMRVCFTWLIMFFKAMQVNAKLYHLHDPELIPCGLLLKLMGKKVILDIHENVAEDIFDKPWIPHKKLLYTFFSFFEKAAIRRFHIFLAENSYEARYKKLGARYTVVLNYHQAEFFEPFVVKDRSDSNRIFYIGILLRSRGILEIAEAIYLLKLKGMEVHFDVVGELYTGLDAEIDALPFIAEIKPQLHFHGRKSLEEGYEISKAAAVGMCIIHPMKNSVASYPTKMFEYMAIGLPQVTSGFPLYKSVVEKHGCGICVDPLKPQEIADAIQKLISDRSLALEMGTNGITAAKAYTWNSEYAKALAVYQQMLS